MNKLIQSKFKTCKVLLFEFIHYYEFSEDLTKLTARLLAFICVSVYECQSLANINVIILNAVA